MAVKILDTNRDFHTYTYAIDSVEDLADISGNVEGSTAIDCSTSDVYILSPSGVWKKL